MFPNSPLLDFIRGAGNVAHFLFRPTQYSATRTRGHAHNGLPGRTLYNIVHLAKPGIIAGSFLVFIPTLGEFVIPSLLGGSRTLMIGKVLWEEFFSNRDWLKTRVLQSCAA